MQFTNNSGRTVRWVRVLNPVDDDLGIEPLLAVEKENIGLNKTVKMSHLGGEGEWLVEVYFGDTQDPDASLDDVPSVALVVLKRIAGRYELKSTIPKDSGDFD